MRISKSFLERKLERFAKDAGLEISKGWQRQPGDDRLTVKPGSIFLGKGDYGGWYVGSYSNENGGEHQLTGWTRSLTAAELVAWFEGAEWAMDHARRQITEAARES